MGLSHDESLSASRKSLLVDRDSTQVSCILEL